MTRPSFAITLAKALSIATKRRGAWAYVPFRLLGCIVFGLISSFFIPLEFWETEYWELSVATYGGILAFNALLLAIGWGAFSKIYEIIGTGEYSKFLKRQNLLDIHIWFVSLVHLSLVISATFNLFAVFSLLMPLPILLDHLIFSTLIALTINSLCEAMRASSMMHDLIWDKAHSEEENQPDLRGIVGGR